MDSTRRSPGATPSAPHASPDFPVERPLTLVEHALRYDRAALLVLLVLTPVFSWWWIVVMARDMYGPMTGASAWMMTTDWDAPHLLLLWAMWAVMMTAMMLPTATPLILLYGAAARRSQQPTARSHIYALAAGYVAAWTAFSLAATVLQRALASLLIVTPMMEAGSSRVSATLLIIAGVYQWTPLKHACLRQCQSPLGFLMAHWRNGWSGAFRLGVEHGTYCIGCCWALMLLLFAGGVMNIVVIAGLTAWVAFEKLAPFGRRGVQVSGAVMIAGGLWILMRGY
jgi:predicted metal-binding membrane protein